MLYFIIVVVISINDHLVHLCRLCKNLLKNTRKQSKIQTKNPSRFTTNPPLSHFPLSVSSLTLSVSLTLPHPFPYTSTIAHTRRWYITDYSIIMSVLHVPHAGAWFLNVKLPWSVLNLSLSSRNRVLVVSSLSLPSAHQLHWQSAPSPAPTSHRP